MECVGHDAGTSQFESLGEFLDRSGKVGKVEVLRCTQCGHGISMPRLPDVAFLYENRESQDYQPDAKGLSHVIKDIAFRSQARKLLRQIGGAGGSILDFGCGSGQFTRVLGELVGGAKVTGADMHVEPPFELIGKPYMGPAELAAHQQGFDTVLAMHVLEHDDDADKLLATIASHVRQGGRIVVEVPNINCVWAAWFGKYWDAWYLPYHRNHFTEKSLIDVMQRQNLDIQSVYGVSVPTFGRSFANIFRTKNNIFWLIIGALSHPLQFGLEVITGRHTAIRIIATKN